MYMHMYMCIICIWAPQVLPATFQLTEASLPQYVLEVVRFFSPVGCVGWAERTVLTLTLTPALAGQSARC